MAVSASRAISAVAELLAYVLLSPITRGSLLVTILDLDDIKSHNDALRCVSNKRY